MTDDLRPEYNSDKLRLDTPGEAVRGKYAQAYRNSSNVVRLDDDVASAFPNERAVNDALRLLSKPAKQQVHAEVPAPER